MFAVVGSVVVVNTVDVAVVFVIVAAVADAVVDAAAVVTAVAATVAAAVVVVVVHEFVVVVVVVVVVTNIIRGGVLFLSVLKACSRLAFEAAFVVDTVGGGCGPSLRKKRKTLDRQRNFLSRCSE